MKVSLYDVARSATSSVNFAKDISITELDLLSTVGVVEVNKAYASGVIESINSQFFLTMDVKLDLTLSCDRCLSSFTESKSLSVESIITEDDSSIDGIFAEDGKVDISKVVVDEIMMSMSMKSLCFEDCKGICSSCGINLNEKECKCKEDEIDPRLSGLLDLLK